MNRKEFLQTSLMGAAALAAVGTPLGAVSACTPQKKAPATPLKLSFQASTALGDSIAEKFDYLETLGIEGYEPGGKALLKQFNEIDQALKGRNIKISAICAGFDGFILAEDPEVKGMFDSSMREIIDAAGSLGSTGVIMVPAFSRQTPCKPHNQETRDYLCEQLHELGEYALQHNTTVILEPLNRAEAFYMRLVSDAAAICRDSRSNGVKCMGDFWHMKEETSDYAAFLSAGTQYLQHVHVAGRKNRKMPGEYPEQDIYLDGMRALKQMGYDKYISFECGSEGDRAVTTPAAVQLLRDQWEQA